MAEGDGAGGGGSETETPSSVLGQQTREEAKITREILERNLKYLEQEREALEKRRDLLTNEAEIIKANRELEELRLKEALRKAEIAVENLEVGTEEYKTAKAALEVAQQQYAIDMRRLQVADSTMKAFDNMFATTLGMSAELSMFGVLLEDPAGFAQGMADSFSKIIKSGAIVSGTFEKILESSMALAYETDQAFVNFQKTTGQIDQFGAEFQQVNDELNQYGVTIDSLTKAQAALMEGSVAFNKISVEQQVAIAGTVAQLEHMGVATANSVKAMQLMTDTLGMSATEAENNTVMLKNLADELPGISADDLAASFSGAGDTIGKFGAQGVDVFRDLARAANASGIAIERLISITEKFDTFSGAADQVGKLNAILGGPFLNSMKMMQVTDPTERIKMLSGAVNDAGLSFDEMGYYQKIALKEALGLKDMTELAKVMAGEFGDAGLEVNKTSAELLKSAEETKKYTTATQEMEQTMREFAVTAQPVLETFKGFLQIVQSLNQAFGGSLIPAFTIFGGVIYGVLGVQKALNATKEAANFLGLKSIGTKIKEIFQSQASTTATIAETTAQEGLNKAKEKGTAGLNKAAPATKSFGAAATTASSGVLSLGAGVFLLGLGMLALAGAVYLIAMAFNDFGVSALFALGAVFALGAGLYFLMPPLIGLAAAAPGVPILIGIAAAMFAIGAAVGIAAAGIGYMASGFAELFEVITFDKVAALGLGLQLLTASLLSLAAAGPLALYGIGLTFLGIGAALASVDTAKAASLGQIFSGLEGISNGNLANLQAALDLVEAIKETVNSLDSDAKVIKLQRVIDSINMTAQGKPAGATAGAGGGTASGAAVQKIYVQIPFKRFEELIGEVVDGKFREIDKG